MKNLSILYVFGWYLLLSGLVGCSGPVSTPLVMTFPEKPQKPPPVNWAEHEDFDLSAYQEPPDSSQPGQIIHDVPERLLSVHLQNEQSGFRIQIQSTLNKKEADSAFEDALRWWKIFEDDPSLRELYPQKYANPPVYQDFASPYYRVRIGDFIHREDAERLLKEVRKSYDRAIVAPDKIPIR